MSTEVKNKVERLFAIKAEQKVLSEEKEKIVKELEDFHAYQNEDNTWTRFTKIDNIKELEEKGTVFRSSSIDRYTVKLEILKNIPKELKEEKKENK